MLPLESVPNLSEGRDARVVRTLGEAFASRGARLLDVHSDADHNRSVFTLVGDDDALVDSLVSGVEAAVSAIDLTRHQGVHPRIGAADVVPVVPLGAGDEGRAVAAAHAVGRRLGDELELPVFLYGLVGEGLRPAFYRRGGLTELRRRMAVGELEPAYGPTEADERRGAVLVGARLPLVAFNVTLAHGDLEIAREIAASVRGASGGMPGVQALGLELADGTPQVSTNVIDLEVAPVHELVARIRAEAEARGARVHEGELVGLLPARVVLEAAFALGVADPADGGGVPTAAAREAAASALALPQLPADRVIEWHLQLVS